MEKAKMNKQTALGIEQMNHLRELGLDTSDASFGWIIESNDYYLQFADECDFENGAVYAYTLEDIIDKIKSWTEYNFCVSYKTAFLFDLYDSDSTKPFKVETGESTIEAAYKMLIWCIENKY